MLMVMNKEKSFTQREVSVAVNNALAISMKPSRLGEIPGSRLKHLRAVAQALIEPAVALISVDDPESKLMEPEELVATLLSAALFIQLRHVIGTDKVPMARLSKEVFGKDERS